MSNVIFKTFYLSSTCLCSCSEFQVLAELRLELTQYCEANHTPFTPTVGEPCCAMFSGNTSPTHLTMLHVLW